MDLCLKHLASKNFFNIPETCKNTVENNTIFTMKKYLVIITFPMIKIIKPYYFFFLKTV